MDCYPTACNAQAEEAWWCRYALRRRRLEAILWEAMAKMPELKVCAVNVS